MCCCCLFILELVHVVLLVVSGCVLLPPADCFHCNCPPLASPGFPESEGLRWITPGIRMVVSISWHFSPTANDSFPPSSSCMHAGLDWQTPRWGDKTRPGVITWSWSYQPHTLDPPGTHPLFGVELDSAYHMIWHGSIFRYSRFMIHELRTKSHMSHIPKASRKNPLLLSTVYKQCTRPGVCTLKAAFHSYNLDLHSGERECLNKSSEMVCW